MLKKLIFALLHHASPKSQQVYCFLFSSLELTRPWLIISQSFTCVYVMLYTYGFQQLIKTSSEDTTKCWFHNLL